MIDQFGRNINYLRISVTDRCNLRCVYCMPKDGTRFLNEEQLLTFEEIYKIVNISSKLGISKVRITGGEPLVRKKIQTLIYNIKSLPQIEEVCITTNGILLEDCIDDLIKAGIDGINVSLDTLKAERYNEITRGGDLEKVMRGIKMSLEKGVPSLKINTVIIKHKNDDEVMDFVKLAEKYPIDIRFIELMPIGEGKQFISVSNNELKQMISRKRDLKSVKGKNKYLGPASYFKTSTSLGNIGFISPMSHKICSECNRIRLTSEGFLKQCLHWNYGVDLKKIIRSGANESELEKIITRAIYEKPNEHCFKKKTINKDVRIMSQIGG